MTGWWIARYIERLEYHDEAKRDLDRRCLAWENTVIIKAKNREEAYNKAMAVGRLGNGIEMVDRRSGRKGAWRFEGLTMLLPVYDELEDGAEILWTEYTRRSVRRIRGMVQTRRNLPVFDDREPKDRGLHVVSLGRQAGRVRPKTVAKSRVAASRSTAARLRSS